MALAEQTTLSCDHLTNRAADLLTRFVPSPLDFVTHEVERLFRFRVSRCDLHLNAMAHEDITFETHRLMGAGVFSGPRTISDAVGKLDRRFMCSHACDA